jgi:hypothetical protein
MFLMVVVIKMVTVVGSGPFTWEREDWFKLQAGQSDDKSSVKAKN